MKKHKVILIDIMLPGMNGMNLLGIIKKEHPESEIVIITGKGTGKETNYY